MPEASDRPLQRVTLNLFRDDVAYMERSYGHGWTTEIRRIIAEHAKERKELHAAINAGFGDHNVRT